MLRSISVNKSENPRSQFGRRKGRLRWEGFAEKEGLEWKSEWVMDDESGESMEPLGEAFLLIFSIFGSVQ